MLLIKLLLLLTVVPLIELTVLLRIAERFSWKFTIALVVVTGVLGAWLARREGLKAMHKIQSDLAAGVVPSAAIVDGLLILVAATVLITPGVLTDLCGFALLVAPLRTRIRRALSDYFGRRIVLVDHRAHGDNDDAFIDVAATSSSTKNPSDDSTR